jgi:hypothetical protein
MVKYLLNPEHTVQPLARRMLKKRLCQLPQIPFRTHGYIDKHKKKFAKTRVLSVDFGEVHTLLKSDIESYYHNIVNHYKKWYRPLCQWLADNSDRLPNNLGIDISTIDCMAKDVACQLDDQAEMATLAAQLFDTESVVVHGNKHVELLLHRRRSRQDFWFIDAGYTNFITNKKKWHRLVRNNLHHDVRRRDFPADRLDRLESLPRPWRTSGDRVVVVLASDRHYALHDTTVDQWKLDIEQEIRKHTNRPLEFRIKNNNRKIRSSLYNDLKDDSDVYCVISDSSAAAIEAIWLGIPIITLRTHITQPVARTKIKDINDLYRGSLGDWLCALTYSQFTIQEIHQGHALEISQKYHA